MSAATPTTGLGHDRDERTPCWCCGVPGRSDRMVHLGNHPEVQLCLRCAHFVHQQARQLEDEQRRGLGPFGRGQLRALRAQVVRRGWHHNRVIGTALRRLGRHLP